MKKKTLLGLALGITLICPAQVPVLKVDLNFAERNESEVHEPGYTSWMLEGPRTKTFEGVTFEFKNGSSGASWYKGGVQAPNYARLVNDGIKTDEVELHISGLQDGKHSLVTFHNTFDNPESVSFSPLDVYLNNELIYDNLELTNRANSNDAATTAYFEFSVSNNETVVLKFKSDPPSSTYSNEITICGFHLNSSDPKLMASYEYPEDKDQQVNIDNDTLLFRWQSPEKAVSHNVYFGTNPDSVLLATVSDSFYSGNTSDTSFQKTGFYSMENYYWRVDPIDTNGDTTKGDVWYFKKRIKAFPEAAGYGGYSIGGRGGKVVYVTNLNDNGPGSFRDAVENQTGPRTILFNVSGLITLRSRLVVRDDYITIAGQTAPGKGICLRWAPIGVTGDNLIVQNLRMRLGIGITYDGMGLTGANNSIIDHCSISWTIDEAFSSRNGKNLTLQRTLISEALNAAGHSNYSFGNKHGYAASIGGDIGSFHHNLLAHCEGRNWSLAGGLDGNSYYAGRLDIFNNVVYNWGGRATDGGAHEVNFVNNYYKKGAATSQNTILRAQLEGTGNGTQSYYYAGNIVENTNGDLACDGSNNSCSREYLLYNGQDLFWDVFVDAPFFPSEATINSASDAYKLVLSDVGSTQPVMDNHDLRIIDETLNGSYSCRGSYTNKPGLPDHEKDVNAWEIYPGLTRNSDWDTDLDGLPDWWEKTHGLNSNSAIGDFTETNADADKNGYTNLEEYLHWMDRPHYFLTDTDSITIDLTQYSRGFTNSPEFVISDVKNGSAELRNSESVVLFKANAEGLASVSFKVTDAEGSSMTQTLGFFKGNIANSTPFTYAYALDRDSTTLVTVDSVLTYSAVVYPEDTTSSIVKQIPVKDLSIYPNPAQSVVKVDFESVDNTNLKLEVFTLTGQLVIDQYYSIQSGENTLEINVSDLAAGLYLIKLHNAEANYLGRFVKN